MKRWTGLFAVALLAYAATGFYIVKGNEQAVVRRFGRVVQTPDGQPRFVGSGLHYDLPWPWSQVDRVNFHQVRTVSIGVAEVEDLRESSFLQELPPDRKPQFLTGDKNILHLKIDVNYRISQRDATRYLFATESPERRLRLLAEAALSELLSQCGVDFVHTLGRAELQAALSARTEELVARHRLGLEVDSVTIDAVYPPTRVKSAFIDVANARADRARYIHTALAYQEQRHAEAIAETRRILDEAVTYKQRVVESARSQADSFRKLVESLRRTDREGIQSYAEARRMALARRYVETMQEVLRKAAAKVVLDSGKPVDLTILRDPKE